MVLLALAAGGCGGGSTASTSTTSASCGPRLTVAQLTNALPPGYRVAPAVPQADRYARIYARQLAGFDGLEAKVVVAPGETRGIGAVFAIRTSKPVIDARSVIARQAAMADPMMIAGAHGYVVEMEEGLKPVVAVATVAPCGVVMLIAGDRRKAKILGNLLSSPRAT